MRDLPIVLIEGTYDNFNRLKTRDYSDSTMPDVNFYYDGRGLGSIPNFSKGKTTKVSSSVSETRYTSFDNLGKLLTSEQRTPFDTETAEQATPRVSTYTYDAFGKLISETYPSGRTVKTDYNSDGDVSSVWGTGLSLEALRCRTTRSSARSSSSPKIRRALALELDSSSARRISGDDE